MLSCRLGLPLHHLLPLEVAEHRDDDIQGIEAGLEGDVLVEIQGAGDDVDHNPHEPLLEVLACQSPDAHDAQSGGEGVGHRNVGVGETAQDEIDEGPDRQTSPQPDEGHLLGHVTDGEVGLLLVTPPGDETVDGHGEVIELHAAVGIEAFLVIQYDAEALHHEADDPHPDAGLVFQEDVGQAEGRGGNVEPMGGEDFQGVYECGVMFMR